MEQKKFTDGLNTAVFTTKFILDKQTAILNVYHYDEDGAWEFSGKEDCEESDFKIVSLDEIIKIDDSVLEVSDLPFGYYAYRENHEDDWKIDNIK